MPQEGRRSIGYRPFITCNDPRGVVESGAIRKQKKNHVVKNDERGMAMVSNSESAEKKLMKKKKKSAIDDVRSHRLDSSEEPSTSSSQSLKSFLLSSSSPKKDKKKSNLIERLIGRKVLNQQKPDFDLDSVRKRRTFDQMIEALKFRGNTKTSVLNEVESSQNPDLSNSNHWLSLVLMKPSKFSCLNLDNPIIPKPRAEVDEQSMLHKMRVRTNPLAEAKLNEDRAKGRKRIPKSESSSNSKQNFPKNEDEVIDKAISLAKCEKESLLKLEDSNRLIEDPSQIEITDYVDDDQSSSNETPLSFSNWSSNNNNTSLIYPDEEEEVEVEDYVCVSSSSSLIKSCSRKASSNENKLKELLLSSSSFINHVEESFNLKGNLDNELNIEHNDQNARLLIDLANELVELHGYECSRAYKTSTVSCNYTSLEQILDTVCEEIESFGCYVKDGESTDNLLLLVKEDFRGMRMSAGVWDVGWRNLGSGDEFDEITRGIDQIVLDGLIQEILIDLTL